MGEIYLELTVANIHDRERQQEIAFLVDTGATRAWIPKEIADRLGIQPIGTLALELADGSIKEFPYGFCLFDFGGETIAGNVIIGPPGSEPIVGTHVLQDFRLVIDMERHTVSRRRAMKAK
ncbi:MAG: aspartyl protease family protein [Anaerolineae bacterium]|nr:aspartyl protease family protein [Anaerolineae bacterium]MDW8099730.1 aspartyl protease family protein [Anaerolineae bacterium]